MSFHFSSGKMIQSEKDRWRLSATPGLRPAEIIHEASRTSCRRFPSCSSGREIFRGHSQVKTRPLPRIWAKKPSVPPAETEADAVLDWRRRSVSQYSSGTSLHLLPKGGHPSRSFAVPHVSTTWSLLHFHEESLLSSFT